MFLLILASICFVYHCSKIIWVWFLFPLLFLFPLNHLPCIFDLLFILLSYDGIHVWHRVWNWIWYWVWFCHFILKIVYLGLNIFTFVFLLFLFLCLRLRNLLFWFLRNFFIFDDLRLFDLIIILNLSLWLFITCFLLSFYKNMIFFDNFRRFNYGFWPFYFIDRWCPFFICNFGLLIFLFIFLLLFFRLLLLYLYLFNDLNLFSKCWRYLSIHFLIRYRHTQLIYLMNFLNNINQILTSLIFLLTFYLITNYILLLNFQFLEFLNILSLQFFKFLDNICFINFHLLYDDSIINWLSFYRHNSRLVFHLLQVLLLLHFYQELHLFF